MNPCFFNCCVYLVSGMILGLLAADTVLTAVRPTPPDEKPSALE